MHSNNPQLAVQRFCAVLCVAMLRADVFILPLSPHSGRGDQQGHPQRPRLPRPATVGVSLRGEVIANNGAFDGAWDELDPSRGWLKAGLRAFAEQALADQDQWRAPSGELAGWLC